MILNCAVCINVTVLTGTTQAVDPKVYVVFILFCTVNQNHSCCFNRSFTPTLWSEAILCRFGIEDWPISHRISAKPVPSLNITLRCLHVVTGLSWLAPCSMTSKTVMFIPRLELGLMTMSSLCAAEHLGMCSCEKTFSSLKTQHLQGSLHKPLHLPHQVQNKSINTRWR